MGRFCMTIILACFMCCPGLAVAAEPEEPFAVPRLFGTFAPKPGVWSEYAVFDKTTGKRGIVRMAIVGVEGDSYWFEVVNSEDGGSNTVKMLIKGDPNDPENIQRLIMKSGTNPAQEMPRDFAIMGRRMAGHMFEQHSGIPVSPTIPLKNIKTGEGTATVPAGTFVVSLHNIVDQNGRVYAVYKFSQKVRPFGVVASEADKTTMVLVGHGTGATSLIVEDPIMMTKPPGMPEGMPPGTVPGMSPPPGIEPGPERGIRQIPGMGTGYEPER